MVTRCGDPLNRVTKMYSNEKHSKSMSIVGSIPRKPRNVPNSRKLPLLYLVVFVVMIMSHVGVQKPERKHCHSLQRFSRQYRLTWSIYHKFL